MRKDIGMAKKQRRTFTAEQKAHAVAAYDECKNLAQVGRDLGISPSVIRSWVKQARVDRGQGVSGEPTTAERAEIARLKRELRKTEQERDFLKKAAAFFAAEETRGTR